MGTDAGSQQFGVLLVRPTPRGCSRIFSGPVPAACLPSRGAVEWRQPKTITQGEASARRHQVASLDIGV